MPTPEYIVNLRKKIGHEYLWRTHRLLLVG